MPKIREVQQFELWLANMNPRFGTEVGKTRPVVVVQTDLLNEEGHPSTLVCPMTTNLKPKATILRVNVHDGQGGLLGDGAILVDQITAIDNRRFKRKLGKLPKKLSEQLKRGLLVMLDL